MQKENKGEEQTANRSKGGGGTDEFNDVTVFFHGKHVDF